MNHKYTILVGLLFALVSCSQLTPSEENGLEFPHIVDPKDDNHSPDQKNSKSFASYDLLYLGPEKDTITVDWFTTASIQPSILNIDDTSRPEKKSHYYYRSWVEEKTNFIPFNKARLQVIIDTSQIINNKTVTSYPVLIKNLEEDTVSIAYDGDIYGLLEAKDKSGKWKPIEEHLKGCGYEVGLVLLPPKEIALTAVKTYNGDTQTQFRLNIGRNYSNIFSGKINYEQFTEKW